MTAIASSALGLLLIALVSGHVQLDSPLYIGGTDDQLTYDDGTAYWLTWDGLYRGVWFNLDDFWPSGSWEADNTEFWFYHHSIYPWDTACFYAEIWNGDDFSGPAIQLNKTSVIAVHYSPAYASYSIPIECEEQFWVIVNTEMSNGGWPSLLSDNSAQPSQYGDHSFYSDDFIVWTPWVPSTVGLNRTTWAEVKTLFDIPLYRSTPGCCDYFIRANAEYWVRSSGIVD